MSKRNRRRGGSRTVPAILLTLLSLAVVALMILRIPAMKRAEAAEAFAPASPAPTGAVSHTAEPSAAPSDAEPDPTPGQDATPAPTAEPKPEYFTISMVGDCSMASNPDKKGWAIAYESVINGDYSYPFANTKSYFEDDYLTIANMEGNLSDRPYSSIEWFTFLSPAAYANILTEGGVDFVTLANNHTMDFGQNAYNDTTAALDAVDLAWAGENETYLYQTGGGLKVGLYCLYNRLTYNSMTILSADAQKKLVEESRELISHAEKELREQGAEYVIACLHMGREGFYEPTEVQTEMCRYAVDAGFDLVYCTHAHRLQPAEKYKDGMIFYGMGNWTFGGHTNPGNGTDPGAYDTGIARVTVCRQSGKARLESFDFIPCCLSSNVDLTDFTPNPNSLNNYQPTPYVQGGKSWERAMSMLNGTYAGANYITDYGNVLQAMNG